MALCNILACGGMPGYQHGEEMLYAEVNGRARELTVFTIMRGCRAPRTSFYFLFGRSTGVLCLLMLVPLPLDRRISFTVV